MTLAQNAPVLQPPPVAFDPVAAAALATSASPAKPVPAPNATLLAREDVTDSMAAFTLALDQPFAAFRPGQYVSLGVVGGRHR